ncbi:MAG: BrnA antitoxin family protein [Alcanivoracaceae bacterium]|nr:BrnA antitoxin family protein [Alcanivoracaceae bacterium]
MKAIIMRESYDFSKSKKNPYAKRLKKQITIRIEEETIIYFKEMAEEKGIPYQSLINLYLRDCAKEHRQLEMKWSQ